MSRTTTRTSLGMLVRQKRDDLRMSMEDLATRSRVSRSTLHRIEHDHAIRPTAPKLAQILTVLEIGPEEVRAVLNDENYLGDVLHWMERSAAFAEASNALRPAAHLGPLADKPDLIVIDEASGDVARVYGGGERMAAALQAAGFLVTQPRAS